MGALHGTTTSAKQWKRYFLMSKKILALHGYAMNSDWFRQWLTAIETSLAGRAVLDYPRAPIECPEAEVRAMMSRFQAVAPEARIGTGLNWCWFRATDDKPPRYIGLGDTLTWLQRYCDEHGPFDGVLGWSQGAVMAAIMAAVQQNGSGYDFGLKWLVLCGGFLPGDAEVMPWFASRLHYPSLHVVGKKESEFLQQRACKLHAVFENAQWLETPLGHMMPVQYPEYMNRISDWIAAQLGD
jgi:pimeloyl-ACP methyl ester carboxylesterase